VTLTCRIRLRPSSIRTYTYKDTESGGYHDEEVTSHDSLSVVAHEGQPALAGIGLSAGTLGQILADRARGNPDAQLQFQLVGDVSLSPGRVVSGHLADQRLEILRQTRRSCRTGLPPPEQTEPLAMPSDQRLGLNHNQSVAPVEPPAHEAHQPTSGIVGPARFSLALLKQGKLLA
jgi:hypothetical protein